MKRRTFRGGIHPYDGKELTKDIPVRVLKPESGELMVFPVSQHIGAPAKPCVTKGDYVKVGQMIAQPGGFVSAAVISSVSGTVKGVEPRMTTSGNMVDCIVIENDGQETCVDGYGTERDYTKLSKEEIVELVKNAGVIGMGGAGFPTHIKLMPKEPEKIDYIIANGAECEPYLTSDYRKMLDESHMLIEGLKIHLRMFPNAKAVIGIEDNKPDAIAKLSEMVKDEERISVCPLKTKYPQGGERNLIYAVTGRKINVSMLPADAGCVVDNVDTIIAIANAVAHGKVLRHRTVTITGDAVNNPGNFDVLVGMNLERVIEAAGGFKMPPEKVIAGGPMMGPALFTTGVPVTKTTSALTCLSKDAVAELEPSPCIRCGRCVQVCPVFLVPQKMMHCGEMNDAAGFEALNGMECYECGSCTYICPARRPLTQTFKQMKKAVIAGRKKQ